MNPPELSKIIKVYLLNTGVSASAFSRLATGNSNFFSKLCYQQKVTDSMVERVQKFIADYPNGISNEMRKVPKPNPKSPSKLAKIAREMAARKTLNPHIKRVEPRIDVSNLRFVSRDPCITCGARGDYLCGHQSSNHWAVIARYSMPKRIVG